jgi:hypothetical protein
MVIGKNRLYHWLVEPLDAHTNEVFSRELPAEDALREVRDSKNVPRNLWRVSRMLLGIFRKSRKDLNLKFRIYSQEGNGQIRFYPFK